MVPHEVMTSATGTHSSARYRGARPCKHLNTSRHSLNVMRCGMSSQCRSSCSSRIRPWSSFRVPLMTRAAAFMTRCRLSVQVFSAFANSELPVVPVGNNRPNTHDAVDRYIAEAGARIRGRRLFKEKTTTTGYNRFYSY